jgi:SAM-dependent methyltransferase
MGHWSSFDKKRLQELISSLRLPEHGTALDFGCGRGIFTQVIASALPGWKIFGCDISSEAVESARRNSPGITFFVLGDKNFRELKVDFIHSHHVLEHTFDEKITAAEMVSFAAAGCAMLHSLPCNHEGSLEYRLAEWTRQGMDADTGKFFFEDTAHQRRMSALQAGTLFSGDHFQLKKKYYSNQFWGGIKWISESNFGLVWNIANPFRAVSFTSALKLAGWRLILVFTWFCFFAAAAFEPADRGKYFFAKKILQALCFLLFFWLAIPVRLIIVARTEEEWKKRKERPEGTDMFLIFGR